MATHSRILAWHNWVAFTFTLFSLKTCLGLDNKLHGHLIFTPLTWFILKSISDKSVHKYFNMCSKDLYSSTLQVSTCPPWKALCTQVLHIHFVGWPHDSSSCHWAAKRTEKPNVHRLKLATPLDGRLPMPPGRGREKPWTMGHWDNPQHRGSCSTWTQKEQNESQLFRVKEFMLQTDPQENTAPTFASVFWMVSQQGFRGRLKAGAVYATYFLNT